MNLRNVGSYNIGLDIGTASIGWSVTDANGDLCYLNGKPTWGSRLVPEANKAAEARVHRGQRRRYDRRRQRLDLLQMLFKEEMDKLDPEFFIRLSQARLLREDRNQAHSNYLWPLFNDASFNERDYYKKFPTIYHLRQWLMETDEQADLRLIYLAFHNIVKHRGNFLQQDNLKLSSENARVNDSVERLCYALSEWCMAHDIDCTAMEHVADIANALREANKGKRTAQAAIAPLLGIQPGAALDKKAASAMAKAIAGAIVGSATKMEQIFFIFEEKPEALSASVYLSKDDQVEAFEELCPDDGRELFEALKAVYSAFVLQGILSLVPGGSISANKVAEYDRYKDDLHTLKELVREYVPAKYDEFFRGQLFEKLYPGEKAKYDFTQAKGYTRYNLVRKAPYDEFKKAVKGLFAGTAAEADPRYQRMMEAFEEEAFLRRLKTSDNGAIPFQLHQEEMDKIIERQSCFYPFLKERKRELDSLVSFRIPYYVGPLTKKNARRVGDAEDGELRFAWAERLPGMDNEKIYPWNWEEIIDKSTSAEKFILRMTGTCTYLQGEPVLPKASLLYEEFCVLNELNGAHFTQDGDKERRFDYRDRADMMVELFRNGTVTYKKVEDWMSRHGHSNVHVSGGQGERGFESRLSSYVFFKKDVFGVDELPQADYPMIERIILWNTLFEDRGILRQRLKEEYGDRLDDKQINTICRKRFSGWGKLSKRFLTGIKAQTDNGPMSIMDVLREGDPSNGHGSHAMVLMEALRDDKLRFQELVDAANAEKWGDATQIALEELPGSPALRRCINQAMGIVEEIARIAGHAPENVFVEVTRSEGKKGQRTKRRYDALKEQLAKLREESPEFWEAKIQEELAERAKGNANLSEKLTLYFMQGGKSLYSGRPLDIDRLSEYEVDHILPQSYIKDDSFENKALVLKEENQRKSDQMLLPAEMRRKMRPYWQALFAAGLIGEKKFNNLMRVEVRDKQLKGFINRQIVETSQIVKAVQLMLQARFPETDVLPVKAGLSSELRVVAKLPKCREVNDFHHAHDALLASEIGRFIKTRFPEMFDNPLKYQHAIRGFVKRESEQVRKGRLPYGASFIVSSFMQSGFNEETGEVIRDAWDAKAELGRLKRFLSYRQCHITHMPIEDSGTFWDDTIYSPHDPKKKDQLRLPLKKGLEPKKYGSYSREQFAYFFIYEIEKKGKRAMEFAPVPVSIAAAISSDEGALENYARTLAEGASAEFIGIVRPKVYKYQLVEVDGSLLYVTGQKEVRNGVEVALDLAGIEIVKRIVQEEEGESVDPVTEEELMTVFERVRESLLRYSPRLAKAIKMGEWDDRFAEATQADKKHVLLELLAIAAAKNNVCDLTVVGERKNSGKMQPSFSTLITKVGIVLIDQSITGMFERRTRIGL